MGKSAGTYNFPDRPRPWDVQFARAWQCSGCPVSWYDDCGDGDGTICPRCGAKGEPEKLPEGAKIFKMPEL